MGCAHSLSLKELALNKRQETVQSILGSEELALQALASSTSKMLMTQSVDSSPTASDKSSGLSTWEIDRSYKKDTEVSSTDISVVGSDPRFYAIESTLDAKTRISFIIAALSNSSLFKLAIDSFRLSDIHCERIASCARLFHVGRNYNLPTESRFYVVRAGSLRVYQNGSKGVVKKAAVGEVVNEASCFNREDNSRITRIHAEDNCQVFVIEATDFHSVLSEQKDIGISDVSRGAVKFSLTDEQKTALEYNALTFVTGDVVLKKGSRSKGVYIVLQGFLQSQNDPLKTFSFEPGAILGPGDYFGDISFLGGKDEPARITALMDVVVGFISRNDFAIPANLKLRQYMEEMLSLEGKELENSESLSHAGGQCSFLNGFLLGGGHDVLTVDLSSQSYLPSCNVFSWLS